MGRGGLAAVDTQRRWNVREGAVFAGKIVAHDKELAYRLRSVLAESPDLLKSRYRGAGHPMFGHCYVATETLYHLLGGKEAGWSGYCLSYDKPGVWGPGKETHWWLQNADGQLIDATADQFETPVPYERGSKKAFVTNRILGADPSERSAIALGRLSQRASISKLQGFAF